MQRTESMKAEQDFQRKECKYWDVIDEYNKPPNFRLSATVELTFKLK